VSRPKIWLSWSSGKDSAWALYELRRAGDYEVVGLLTTLNDSADRVAMHAVRHVLLDAQARAAGLPVHKIRLPWPCPNETYEQLMVQALDSARAQGITAIAFGDLFLEDVRRYREDKMSGTGLMPLFPIWGRPTRELAGEMVAAGLQAHVTCVDPRKLDRSFAGRIFDARFLVDLPGDVDPCGENGEFHSFAVAGPMFAHPVAVAPGEIVERDGFVFADLLPV
jgi:uncharacterized protein (TIGR00290 family)